MKHLLLEHLIILALAGCTPPLPPESNESPAESTRSLQEGIASDESALWSFAARSPQIIRRRDLLLAAVDAQLVKTSDPDLRKALEGYRLSLVVYRTHVAENSVGSIWLVISSKLTTGLAMTSPPNGDIIRDSQEHFRISISYFTIGEFERALIEARKVIALWPEQAAARKMIHDITQVIEDKRDDAPYAWIYDLIATLASEKVSADIKQLAKEHNDALKREVERLEEASSRKPGRARNQ